MTLAALAVAGLLLASPPDAAFKPEPREKCPVCGMFVAKYPDWVGVVRFADGSRVVFDGAKDLFKFRFRLEDYGPAARRTDVAAVLVTDYYALRTIDAKAAFYVVGSDVTGPMGLELVPFEREEDAREFLRDHHGKRIVRFAEVTPELVKALD